MSALGCQQLTFPGGKRSRAQFSNGSPGWQEVHLNERPHKSGGAFDVIGVNPSSGAPLKTELSIERAKGLLHFRRENLKRLAFSIATHHTDPDGFFE
jgi:hypothetical protein